MYPKMIYRASRKFADQEGLKLGFAGNEVQTLVVDGEEAEQAALDEGWVESPGDLIGEDTPKRARKKAAAVETPAAEV